MKKRIVVSSVVALAITLGSSALLAGNVNAADAVQKIAHHFGGKGGIRAAINNTELAALLSMTSDELKQALKSGKSLATIAGDQGVEVQKVIDLEIKALTTALDQQLKDGKITQEEYDSSKIKLAETAKEIVNGTFVHKGGSGHGLFKAAVRTNADIQKLLGLTSDELSTQLKAGKSLATIAGEKNVPVQSVIDLAAKAITAELDLQLKEAKITQTQYDTLKANISTHATDIVNGTSIGGKMGRGGHDGGLGRTNILDDAALATLLGMTTDELETEVKAGKSLATIAGEKNVAIQTVIDQVTKSLTADLTEKLADGKLTQAQVDEKKATLTDKATKLVNGTFMDRGGKGGHRHPGRSGLGHDRGTIEDSTQTDAADSSTTTG